jgi:hypothetical protein
MKLGFSGQIFEKPSAIKFHENPSRESRIVPFRQTDKYPDVTKLKVAFAVFANEPKTLKRSCSCAPVTLTATNDHLLNIQTAILQTATWQTRHCTTTFPQTRNAIFIPFNDYILCVLLARELLFTLIPPPRHTCMWLQTCTRASVVTMLRIFTFFKPCIVIYLCKKNQENAHFLH